MNTLKIIGIITFTIVFYFLYFYIPYHKLMKTINKKYDSKKVRKQAKDYLLMMKKYVATKGYKLFYVCKDKYNINGNATLPGIITISGNWYKGAYGADKDKWIIAMMSTICHELGHKDSEPKGHFFAFTKRRKFVNYCREVRADLYAKHLLMYELNYCSTDILAAHNLKIANYKSKDRDDMYHPTRALRHKLIEQYDFLTWDEAIFDIADYVGLDRNNKEVKKMIDWYKANDLGKVISRV